MWDLGIELNLLIEPEVKPYRGPLIFDRSGINATEENVFANAGFTLVDTGQRKLLVTCCHVWTEFLTERERDPRVRLCVFLELGPPVIFQNPTPVDKNERLDLVTFDMEQHLSACKTRKFYPLHRDPPRTLKKGDRLVMVAYPGEHRIPTDEGLLFGSRFYGIDVASVDGLRFQANISGAKVQKRHDLTKARPAGADPHGGVSGSPCFLYRVGRPCVLVGFATAHWAKFDYLFFSSIRCLNPDGTLKQIS